MIEFGGNRMPIRALVIVLAGLSTMLLLGSWEASADELKTADDNLALPDQPAGNETLVTQTGSGTPVNTVDVNNTIVQQPNTIIVPTATTMAITNSGSIDIGSNGSSSSSASIISSASASIIHGGVQ